MTKTSEIDLDNLRIIQKEIKEGIYKEIEEYLNEFSIQHQNMKMRDFIQIYGGDLERLRQERRESISSTWSSTSQIHDGRRITLQGLEGDLELSCFMPKRNQEDGPTEENMENMSVDELKKLQEALKAAQDQAQRLLASYGL